MIARAALMAGLLAAASPLAAAPPNRALPAPVDYAKGENWVCLPGRGDICSRPLPTTALNPNGYGATGPSPIATDPAIDCFFVYPTVSHDQGLNSDLVIADDEERYAVQNLFARFAGACRPFAPKYRQMTVAAVAAAATGADVTAAGMLAYADVAGAWKTYLEKFNRGRPFVLIGHSQGSLLLIRLIARAIEGRPEAARMKLAILPGFNLLVPHGKLVGGDLKKTPLCSQPGETGCVLSWVSYRERNAPPEGALFGHAGQPGMTVACVNPARPGASGWVPLDSYWNGRTTLPVPGGPIRWSSEGPPPTPWLRTEGLVSGRCVNDGPRGYLSIRTNADPGDPRTDRIGGEVGALGFFLPGWGMHLIDLVAPQGDLIRQVAALNLQAKTGARQAR